MVQGAAALGGGDEKAGLVVELEDCAHALAARKFKASPFGWSAICKAREGWKQVLDKAGISSESHPEDPFQAATVRLLGAVLRSAGDPDSGFPDILEWGVPLVFDEDLPLIPDVFEQKTKWSVSGPNPGEEQEWRSNYKSAKEHPQEVLAQFRDDAK